VLLIYTPPPMVRRSRIRTTQQSLRGALSDNCELLQCWGIDGVIALQPSVEADIRLVRLPYPC
jgi:hypothetical protein